MDDWNEAISLRALSPLDGRYAKECAPLRGLFSERALFGERVTVEVHYWLALLRFLDRGLPAPAECAALLRWACELDDSDLSRVKCLEQRTHHDIKAVEYFIREHVKGTVWEKHSPWIHWGLTSEDTDNLAYGRLMTRAVAKVMLPAARELVSRLLRLARRDAQVVLLGRTHGQVAVPTTLGKEWAVFLSRAHYWLKQLQNQRFGGKLNGAVGNLNAQSLLFPERDWLGFGAQFVRSLGLEPTLVTTQIEPASQLVAYLDRQRQLNNVWLDLCQNVWLYTTLGVLRQVAVAGEVGSSTMPHKVNPIHFENAEGNLQVSNALLQMLSSKLSLSRLQRDLSDKTVKRNIGVALGHSLVAAEALLQGLSRLEPDSENLREQVAAHPEVLAEALQLWRRARGEADAFGDIQAAVRGDESGWAKLVQELDSQERSTVSTWSPEAYIGLAAELAQAEADRVERDLGLPEDPARIDRGDQADGEET